MNTLLSRRRVIKGLTAGTVAALCALPQNLWASLTKAPGFTPDPKLLKMFARDWVKTEYIQMGHLRSKSEVWNLHCFFSPSPIPPSLTRDEIEICFQLNVSRERQKQAHRDLCKDLSIEEILAGGFLSFPADLPQELRGPDPMTREKFRIGVKKLEEKNADRKKRSIAFHQSIRR